MGKKEKIKKKDKTKNIISKNVESSNSFSNYGLYHIKNKFIFNSTKKTSPEYEHLYVVFLDKKNNVDRVVGTTHLYEKVKSQKISNGELKVYQFGGQNEPSGVYDGHYKLNNENKPFKLNTFKKAPYTIQKSQAQSIFSFAKHKRR